MDELKSDSSNSSTHLTALVFTPVCSPRIESISHEALVKWEFE